MKPSSGYLLYIYVCIKCYKEFTASNIGTVIPNNVLRSVWKYCMCHISYV